jgi:cytochrome c1
VAWITDPQQLKPGTPMPKLPLTQADIVELASFLSKMKQH